jgi:hypothetical protein
MSQQTFASSTTEGGKLGALFTKGSGSGNYQTASTSYVNVDNGMNQTWIVPLGFALLVSFVGVVSTSGGAATVTVGILDQFSDGSGGGLKSEQAIVVAAASATQGVGFGLQWMVVGDGKAHNIIPQFKTSANTGVILNNTAAHSPSVLCELTPSNVN